jgi:hypothetical protein
MADILHRVGIRSSADKVYEALSEEKGLSQAGGQRTSKPHPRSGPLISSDSVIAGLTT